MKLNTGLLHPDDLLFFQEIRAAMFRVAKAYDLPLRTVEPFPMPEKGMADRMGDCSLTCDIRLVLRCTVNGTWCEDPISPEEMWDTASHELAHLKYLGHGVDFQTFRLELLVAMRNQQQDHREKVIARLVKMQASRQGEADLGNTEAAEAFAAAINRMLLEHELSPSDLDYARATDNDPVIEMRVNFGAYNIERKRTRVAWQESLARIVAKAHLCSFLIRKGSNDIWFVGTKSHATVAEYVFGTLAPAADKMSEKARWDYRYELRRKAGVKSGQRWSGSREILGFREAWLVSFIDRIGERFEEARQAAVGIAPEGTSVALIRLDGAVAKVRQYIDNKFSSRRASGLTALSSRKTNHADGVARGRAAADAMTIGRRGITGGSPRKLLS